jgi:uncharacterized membrane protein YbhN (UPF0104 family)
MDRLAGVFLIGIAIAALMLRWEIIPSPAGAEVHFKLNRLTGRSYFCNSTGCKKTEAISN